MRTYRNMLSRVKGIQKREAKFYKGLPILEKEDFYRWSLDPNSVYWKLHKAWKESEYSQKLSPSIDRLDVLKGYTLENIQWTTHGLNSGKLTRRAQGEAHHWTKLTAAKVLQLRDEHSRGIKGLARKHNLNSATVSVIVSRKNWKHLEGTNA